MIKKIAAVALVIATGCCLALGVGRGYASAQALDDEIIPVVTHTKSFDPYEPIACSWYGCTSIFTGATKLGPYYFDGSNVGIEMNCSSSAGGSFTVTLYRGGSSGGRVGSATFSKRGFTKATWSNVGSGSYSFGISRIGSSRITANDIAMYSW